jgi:hypothetical protein
MDTTTAGEQSLTVGDIVTVEKTIGSATSTPEMVTIQGPAWRDEEGILRVGDPDGGLRAIANIERDQDGYFPRGVAVVSIVKPSATS